jgi:hypothetical protein
MRAVVLAFACLSLVACAAHRPPITAEEFGPHLRFRADNCPEKLRGEEMLRCLKETRERALAECKHQARMEGDRAFAATRGVLTPAVAGAQAQVRTLQGCMDAKGYGWREPRYAE